MKKAKIIDGREVSKQIKEELKEKTDRLIQEKGVRPGLAVALVGDDPGSQFYVKSKEKTSKELGYHSIVERLPESTSEQELLDLVQKWNEDDNIHGILVQSPLPKHMDEDKVVLAIDPKKDVDGFHPVNVGNLVIGLPGHVSCTPLGIVELLKRYNISTSGKHCVVVGRSNIVGKPIANLMYQKKEFANSIVTICHSAAPDLSYFTKQADILIVAIGRANLIKEDMVKEGAVVIDVGINRVDDDSEKGYHIAGDVDFDNVSNKASSITPVPGGVGLMTIAMLMTNTFNSANEKAKSL